MNKTDFWNSEMALGVLVTLLVLLLAVSTQLIRRADLVLYDMAMRMTSAQPSDKIAIIAIDKQSIDRIGPWPWPREIQAEMIDKLALEKPAVIGTTIFHAEAQLSPGLSYINRLVGIYNAAEGLPLDSSEIGPEVLAEQPGWLGRVGPVLREADQRLNTDKRFANSIRSAGNVVLPILWGGEQAGGAGKVLPEFVVRTLLPVGKGAGADITKARSLAVSVLDEIGMSAAAVGHLTPWLDSDGRTREETIVMDVYGQVFPSLSLAIAARAMSLVPTDIQIQGGDSVNVAKLKLETNSDTRLHTLFYSPSGKNQMAFPEDSWLEVAQGKVSMAKYRDKIVLIGVTAPDAGNFLSTPVDPRMSELQALAHKVSNILKGQFIANPGWGRGVTLLFSGLAAAYVILLLPGLKFRLAVAVTAGSVLFLVAVHFVLMTQQRVWIELMLPAILLLAGHALLLGRRALPEFERVEQPVRPVPVSNRTLGLAYQAQGQFDMAFDKLLKCLPDEALMDSLYRLALEFERMRQFGKAEQVFRHMAGFNPGFKDLGERLLRIKLHQDSTLPDIAIRPVVPKAPESAAPEKPTLGRYQIEKTLGDGAMGPIYLGRDAKINRLVTIKTLALSKEFEEGDLAQVKQKFFREAETAGRLNHPNIVTIYDAGEVGDQAYIAMEVLKGRDLSSHTRIGALLEMGKAISIVTRVADALAYAHRNNVVHRDIKPANIMYELETDQVKVIDFGIARITESTRTRTGVILGTPSYMSPEQLAGVKIDGRSDLFSLGIVIYQLLSGVLPFSGETMSELMQNIANESPLDVRTYNSGVPEVLAAIIDRALTKDLGLRYQMADEMAQDLRRLVPGKSTDVDFLL